MDILGYCVFGIACIIGGFALYKHRQRIREKAAYFAKLELQKAKAAEEEVRAKIKNSF